MLAAVVLDVARSDGTTLLPPSISKPNLASNPSKSVVGFLRLLGNSEMTIELPQKFQVESSRLVLIVARVPLKASK